MLRLGMNKILVEVEFTLPASSRHVTLELKPEQMVGSERARKRMRALLGSAITGLDVSHITFSCEAGRNTPIPAITAEKYVEEFGKIHVRAPDCYLQLLQSRVVALEASVKDLSERLIKVEGGTPKLLRDQAKHRKISRRNIVVHARDTLSREGNQPAGVKFEQFSRTLTAEWLQQRHLTLNSIALINGHTIPDGDCVAHGSSEEVLMEGLEGLEGAKLGEMLRLYHYVIQRL